MIYKVCWSGGKDSTAAMYLHLQEKHNVHSVCYIPMLTEEIPLIMPEHYKHIIRTADYFRKKGAIVDIVSGITYEKHVHTILTKGKNKGKFRGIGLGFGFCLFRDYSKLKALRGVKFSYDYEDIGIAFDEIKRHSQLVKPKMSILCDKGYTEKDAMQICYDNGILSPIYKNNTRDGCAICPNAKKEVLQQYIKEYPNAKYILLEIERFCKTHRPENAPYRNNIWFSEKMC